MAIKVVIENAILRGSQYDLQKVATVYLDGGDEYYVYAPSRATGNALEWVEHLSVRALSKGNPSSGGEVVVNDWGRSNRVIHALTDELEKHELDADIWRNVNSQGRYCAAQICLRGHVHSMDGSDFKQDERCQQCSEICIDRCQSCKAPIRGAVVFRSDYTLPLYCYKCGRAYPWMEDRQQTAKELLDHDDKLSLEEREKLWDLLQYVMSDPKSDLAPAKKKLIDIKLERALPVTREFFLDFLAKVAAEMMKP